MGFAGGFTAWPPILKISGCISRRKELESLVENVRVVKNAAHCCLTGASNSSNLRHFHLSRISSNNNIITLFIHFET